MHACEHPHSSTVFRGGGGEPGAAKTEVPAAARLSQLDFPKGLVEAGEETDRRAALREVREETTLDDLSFDWGLAYMDTGPYNKGKFSRYYIARSKETKVLLPINPDLGMPEHHEACWVDFAKALTMVSPRVQPVVRWAHGIINHEEMLKR